MPTISVTLRNIPATEAAIGWAGSHTVVVDRPEGRAGGMGLGFNGGQMLGLAIGGCLCNDLRYVAHEAGIELTSIEVDVTVELSGTPLKVDDVILSLRLTAADARADLAGLVRRAEAESTVSNSVKAGFPVTLNWAG